MWNFFQIYNRLHSENLKIWIKYELKTNQAPNKNTNKCNSLFYCTWTVRLWFGVAGSRDLENYWGIKYWDVTGLLSDSRQTNLRPTSAVSVGYLILNRIYYFNSSYLQQNLNRNSAPKPFTFIFVQTGSSMRTNLPGTFGFLLQKLILLSVAMLGSTPLLLLLLRVQTETASRPAETMLETPLPRLPRPLRRRVGPTGGPLRGSRRPAGCSARWRRWWTVDTEHREAPFWRATVGARDWRAARAGAAGTGQ